jgi:hypothetical protein
MVLNKRLIVHERRVLANLLGYFTVSIEESVKIREVSLLSIASAIGIASTIRVATATSIASAISMAILSTGIAIAQVPVATVAIFQSHERVGVLADLLFHTRVILKIRIELRMILQELRGVDEGRRFAKLVGNFVVAVKKLIESGHVSVHDVIALDSLPVLRGRRLGVR